MRGNPDCQQLPEFIPRGCFESAPRIIQRTKNLGFRVRFHRVMDESAGKGSAKCLEIAPHAIARNQEIRCLVRQGADGVCIEAVEELVHRSAPGQQRDGTDDRKPPEHLERRDAFLQKQARQQQGRQGEGAA